MAESEPPETPGSKKRPSEAQDNLPLLEEDEEEDEYLVPQKRKRTQASGGRFIRIILYIYILNVKPSCNLYFYRAPSQS